MKKLPYCIFLDKEYVSGINSLEINMHFLEQVKAKIPGVPTDKLEQIQRLLKDKINNLGGCNSDLVMPDGLKPSSQKTKTFFTDDTIFINSCFYKSLL